MSYPTTTTEFLKTLKKAASVPSRYWNQFPYNLGYMHSDGVVSFDCVNLVKAILNGWQYSKTIGSYCHSLSRTGDCTEWGLLEQCSNVSRDFSKLNYVAVLYMDGHIGTHIGEDVVINGKTYNTIECTAAWGGGVLYSYTDKDGARYNHKDGSYSGRHWTHHGMMTKWLKYEKEKKGMNFKDVKESDPKYKYIKKCFDAGLIKGYSDGTFRPNEPITRADVCIIISRLLSLLNK